MGDDFLLYIDPRYCLMQSEDCTHGFYLEDQSIAIDLDPNLGEFVSYTLGVERKYNGHFYPVEVQKKFVWQGFDTYQAKGDRDVLFVTVYASVHKFNPDTNRVDLVYNYQETILLERDCCYPERQSLICSLENWMPKEVNAYFDKSVIGKHTLENRLALMGVSNILWFLNRCSVTCEDLDDMKCLFDKLKNACLCAGKL